MILALDLGLGLAPASANALGYAVGAALSLWLHRRFVFRSSAPLGETAIKYAAAVLLAFALNQLVLKFAGPLAGEAAPARAAAQGLAVASYVAAQFGLLRFWVFAGEAAGWMQRRWPELAAAAALGACLVLLYDLALPHDPVWQLWIGRQMGAGADLYSDILEINPPLWFWLAVPLVRLAEALGAPPAHVLVGFFFLAIALAGALTSRLVREQPPAARAGLYAAMLFALVFMLRDEFTQREHYALIAAVPYAALISRRLQGQATSVGLALLVGAFAASGFALKHYFVAVPAALELLLLASLRRDWRPLRPELVALAAAALAYAAAVFAFEPDFLTGMAPRVALAYSGYEVPLHVQLGNLPFAVAALVALGLWLQPTGPTPLARAFLVAAFAFLLACLLQLKGWRYHGLPAVGFLILAVAVEAPRLGAAMGDTRARTGVWLIAAAAASVLVLSLLHPSYYNAKREDAEAALAGLRPGQSVMVLAVNASTTWPMVEERGLVWPSRHMTYWMIPAIARAQQAGRMSPKLAALADEVREQTLHDLSCRPPARILVDHPRGSPSLEGLAFDYLPFFRADPQLAAFLDHYRPGPTYGRFRTLELADPAGLPAGRACRPLR